MRPLARSVLILALVAALCVATSVQAQQTRMQRGSRMSPEQTQAALTLQASHVAGKLGLSEEQTTKLVDTYKKAREGYNEAERKVREKANEALSKMREEGEANAEDRRAMYQAMREARQKGTKAVTEKFAKEVGAILDEEKAEKAVTQLGTFSGSWDRMVNVIAGLELDKAKQTEALDLVSAYTVESTAAREKATAGGDREAMRTIFLEQRAKLNEAMGKVLSEEQMTKWTEATARRGGGRRGGPPGGGGDQ